MNRNSQTKLVVGALLIVFVFVALQFLHVIDIGNLSKKTSESVDYPTSGYAPGTSISQYSDIPPGFPTDIILENKTLSHSSVTKTPDGVVRIVVSYVSEKSPADVATSYARSLPNKHWDITMEKFSSNISYMLWYHR